MSRYLSEEIRQRVREQAGNRCGYCLSSQHLVLGTLEIEHLIPRGRGGSDEEDNPRKQRWSDHFRWIADGTKISGRTPSGRATVIALQLNNRVAVTVRRYCSSVVSGQWSGAWCLVLGASFVVLRSSSPVLAEQRQILATESTE